MFAIITGNPDTGRYQPARHALQDHRDQCADQVADDGDQDKKRIEPMDQRPIGLSRNPT